ncbi:hypothetical protein AMTR_s00089p00097600 [Amborella trichopoda]|uniref:Uncharacterized protein n=1 Tax=Amborella trichopoda TaxID=13333 RepID=W1P4H2_AMBTC|nr:hypothetical protein AMTR_s00089p00097600 [Amborella trichopoda]
MTKWVEADCLLELKIEIQDMFVLACFIANADEIHMMVVILKRVWFGESMQTGVEREEKDLRDKEEKQVEEVKAYILNLLVVLGVSYEETMQTIMEAFRLRPHPRRSC